eukprot:UN04734
MLNDLADKPHFQALLHTKIILGTNRDEDQILKQTIISIFAFSFGYVLTLFPWFFISDSMRGSLASIWFTCVTGIT